jgi:hypothetical protein
VSIVKDDAKQPSLVKKLEELHISPSVLGTTAHERLVGGGMLMSLLIGPGSHIPRKDTAKNIYGALQQFRAHYLSRWAAENNPGLQRLLFRSPVIFLPPHPELSLTGSLQT